MAEEVAAYVLGCPGRSWLVGRSPAVQALLMSGEEEAKEPTKRKELYQPLQESGSQWMQAEVVKRCLLGSNWPSRKEPKRQKLGAAEGSVVLVATTRRLKRVENNRSQGHSCRKSNTERWPRDEMRYWRCRKGKSNWIQLWEEVQQVAVWDTGEKEIEERVRTKGRTRRDAQIPTPDLPRKMYVAKIGEWMRRGRKRARWVVGG